MRGVQAIRLRVVAMLVGIATCTGILVAAPLTSPTVARAAEPQFRYWTYWTGTADGWQFSPVGPAFRDAQDGVVEGWRLAVTGVTATAPPRVPAGTAFDAVCDGVPASPGTVRVAVVVDFGTPADAPAGERPPAAVRTCVEVDDGDTGFDALRQVVEIRSERGLVCGLAGYPRTGCAERVEDPGAGAVRPDTPGADDTSDGDDRTDAGAADDPGPDDAGGDDAGAGPGGVDGRPEPSPTPEPGSRGPSASPASPTGTDDELARAAGDGDPMMITEEPTYPASDAAVRDTRQPAATAPATAAAQSVAVPATDANPLRSPWLAVPVLVLIAALGLTAWRRSRAARASGGHG
jgi:hypothetical protein